MLSPDDAALIARDGRIAGLAVLLDPELLAERVAKAVMPHWGPVSKVHAEYLRYKPGTSLVTAVRVATEAGEHWAYAVAGAPGHAGKLAKSVVGGRRAADDFDPCLDQDLVLVAPPSADPAVRGALRLFADPSTCIAGATSLRVLRYRPGRRVVVRLDGADGPIAVARAHPAKQGAHLAMSTGALIRAGLPVARMTRLRRGGRLSVFEYLPGDPVVDGTDPDVMARAGALLARVHQVHPAPGGPVSHARHARSAVRAVEALVPSSAGPATEASRVALAVLDARPGQTTTTHGDFSADQLLDVEGCLALLDLDRVGPNRAVADVASWFAAEAVAGRWSPAADPARVLSPLTTALLEGRPADQRAAAADDVRQTLPALVSLALLRRAAEPFRTRAPGVDWAIRVEELVAGAAAQVGLS